MIGSRNASYRGYRNIRPFQTQLLLLLFFAALSEVALSQSFSSQRYWIHFRDRDNTTQLLRSSTARQLEISDRALLRRAKVLPGSRVVDELDLPPDQSYLEHIRRTGATIRSTSRWFNAVSAELTAEQLNIVRSMPFVAAIEPVGVSVRKHPDASPPVPWASLRQQENTIALDYGPSFTQLDNINVVDVHKQGINGSGVIIGMIDDGFNNHKTHPGLKNSNILAEYDFIQRDSSTSRALGEYGGQGNHGAATLSVVGGFENGKLIGVAYGASFILAKTEIDSTEIRVEEDLYVEALEWMERLGADIVSTSLGYVDWYTYADLDGKTATTSKAARIAARKGVLLVTAMGNEGWYRDARTQTTGTIVAPADADSIIAVGATSSDGIIASFSSTGPTADGRVKPEVVAQGVNVYVAGGESGYGFSNGTSFSTPLSAGVAALVLSANPTLTPMEIRARMMTTARQIDDGTSKSQTYPNNFYGKGMLDAFKAAGLQIPIPERFVLYNNYPNPFNGATTIVVDAPEAQEAELAVYNVLGQRIRTIYKGTLQVGENRFAWGGQDDDGKLVATGMYIYRLTARTTTLSNKLLYIK